MMDDVLAQYLDDRALRVALGRRTPEARRLRRLLTEFIDWKWIFPLNGKVRVRNKRTGEVVVIGRIEPRKIGRTNR